MATLARLPSSLPFIQIHRPSYYPSKRILPVPSGPLRIVSLSSTPPGSVPQAIFLHLLEEQEEDGEEEEQSSQSHNQEEEVDTSDPIVSFLKSRTSTPDPPREGKFSLQKNRRTSWRLAPELGNEPEPETKPEAALEPFDEAEEGEKSRISSANVIKPDGVVGEIVGIARNLPENSTLGELLEDFEGRIDAKECVEVLDCMGKEGLYKGCLYFYEWMRLQEPSLVTPRACSVLFPLLGRVGMGNMLMVLFMNLPKEKKFRDVHIYNGAISGLMHCGRYDDAWKVYEVMETNNIRPDHITCSLMITIMRKSGRSAKEAYEFFERMNRKGVEWSQEGLGALIKSFCDEGLKNEALIIQSEMERKGIRPNAIIYNTLMDAYCKSNHIEEAEGLFAEMKTKGLKPTNATFNILMDAYSKRMQPDIVERLLKEIQDLGLEPNAKSYTCLISAYGRQKEMSDMAADVFLRMKRVGIKPTSHSYTALIHAYSVGGWHEKAYITFENMLREQIKPSIETYTALLDAFRRAGDTKKLMQIWKLMIHQKVEGTRVTFNILVDGFAKQGHYIEARDVISEFGKIGLQPTVMTYNMLMNAYARGGQHEKLPQLLKEMATLNLKPDSVTFSTMIYAYVRVRDFKRAFIYHKMMVKTGQVPDVKSYEKLRAILDVKAAKGNKKDRSAILGIVNSKMGLLKAKKKRKKDEFWKNRKNRPRIRNVARES
ncbi:Pentatricopeptide repeat superfamily protein isoform 1 [Tripterygium wilfordii]|uniref:Pentatricopeptide repeat superfamily protein isoform 1 n=1 Tax=Tripterygium wilfordii TaxID=458696 RepID=A0A7J7C9Y9_TRIWF|nr:pentatricopeptide repeat-containing protein At5g50280, chloroplastic [Tripterygium wilfordii]XP_038685639.1 pentatricopeptide repeat-containing protein At5g50280, chloroplastic [Tripterygium wilfordii]XP_038685640.1 pentatricopeptide repeat-containing protein At5g50280, chloroplastic [Tripterygium wilfordii]XP_038685641.1 pentatricopeptide repeat-containing protein At5g50280, chloroplastic [Tripterygium wilfordii]XP_038685642.1 pentatricopeptide repeat-containing protein At5g50280, chloropla